jgi:hypothetical protein
MAVTMKNIMFWNVRTCSLVEIYQSFGGTKLNQQISRAGRD